MAQRELVQGVAMVRRRSPARGGAVVSRYRLRVGTALVVLALECLALTGLSSWLFPDVWAVSRAVIDIDQSVGSDRGVNLTEVASHPSVMWGRTVTISAEVQEIHSPRLMTIGNDAFFVGDSVLIAAPIEASLWPDNMEENATARVTGIVRKATPAIWTALGIEAGVIPSDYEGKAVLVAETVELNPPSEIGPGDKEFVSGSDGYDIGVTTYDLIHGGDAYLGRSVVVSGERSKINSTRLTPFFLATTHSSSSARSRGQSCLLKPRPISGARSGVFISRKWKPIWTSIWMMIASASSRGTWCSLPKR
jgi:hypothetical protein